MRSAGALLISCLALIGGCVPEGPPTGSTTASKPARPPPRVENPSAVTVRPPILSPFEDKFERTDLGIDWHALSGVWRIQDGRLCGRSAHNRGVWLLRKIPVNAAIEFDAYADSAAGDIKAELWGDGQSGATANSYSNATSYLAILGGWNNSKHVLARLDEHGVDRLELDVDPNSDDERARAVTVGQPYHFKIQRTDGKDVAWSVNGLDYLELLDKEPLVGAGHDHMGFNDWEAPICFDNLKITPL